MPKAKFYVVIVMLGLAVIILGACSTVSSPTPPLTPEPITTFKLPQPRLESEVSIEETLLKRRSTREYANLPLTLEDVSQLLWSAQGNHGMGRPHCSFRRSTVST